MKMFWFVCCSLAVLIFIRLRRSWNRIREKTALIDRIPGPQTYPVIGSGFEYIRTPRTERLKLTCRYHEKFGPIYKLWFGPRVASVHITRPEFAEVLLSSRKNINKSFGYNLFEPWLGTGLLTSSGGKWHTRRKLLTPAFHFSILESFYDIFVENSKLLVEKLKEELDAKEFNIMPYIRNCTLDIICETAMGVKVNAQSHLSEYVASVEKINEIIHVRIYNPLFWSNKIYSRTTTYKKQCETLKVLHGMSLQVIRMRKEQRKNDKNNLTLGENVDFGIRQKKMFLDLLLDMADESNNELKDSDIREEVDTFMFEGHDTVSTCIGWTLFLLGWNQCIQDKVVDEINLMFSSTDRDPSINDVSRLKYLELVIKESLRLLPPVPFIARTLTENTEIGGYYLPSGTTVRLNIYQLHRQPDQFPNPEKFNPDNFLPANVAKRHPFAYVPFSAGPRNCIGQRFANLKLKVLLSTFLRKYKVYSLTKFEDIDVVTESVINPQGGIKVRIEPRKS